MATKQEVKLTAEQKLIGKITNFFENNRLGVIIAAAIVIVAILAAVITVNVINTKNENAQIVAYNLEAKFYELIASDDPDWNSFEAEAKALIKNGSYPSVKAAYVLGLAYYEQQEYADALSAFEKAYNLNTKIYLAPIALVNAAASAEANGDVQKALSLYNNVYDNYPESGVASKALFNVARIYYQQGNVQLAKSTFEQVASYYADSEYGAFATNIANVL